MLIVISAIIIGIGLWIMVPLWGLEPLNLSPLPPEVLEPIRRQLGIAHRVLDVLMAQVGLQGSRIMALIGKGESTGVPQHVRMSLEAQLSSHQRALQAEQSPLSWRASPAPT
jgi:hypothetical protein